MKEGDEVFHDVYGKGNVLKVRRAGLEVRVRFDSGIFLPCSAKELSLISQTAQIPSSKNDHPKPDYDKAFSARQIVEALRFGVVPQDKVHEMTVGLSQERRRISSALGEIDKRGGDAMTVVGEYGSGKSHLFEWTAQEALKQNFLVAKVSLDFFDVAPSRPHRIYNALIGSLRYPDHSDVGSLAPLFDHFLDDAEYRRLIEQMALLNKECLLMAAFEAYAKSLMKSEAKSASVILDWISGEKLYSTQVRGATENLFKKISSSMQSADQYCYLLSGLGWMARQAGYRGLVALLDESEHYSLLVKAHKTYADNFFKGMIFDALGGAGSDIRGCRHSHKVSPDCNLKHGTVYYPYRFAEDCGLFFMFAVTPSTSALDYSSWLDQSRIIRLDNRLSEGEMESLIAQIYVFHRQAYDYDRRKDYMEVGSKLISCYESGMVNLRELIRLSTAVFDLLYSHRDYGYSQLIREISDAFT